MSIWWSTSNSVFLRVVVTNSAEVVEVRGLNGCHGNQTILLRASYMAANKSPQSIAFKNLIEHDFMELYFFRARSLYGSELACRVVFREKQITENLLFWIQIDTAKNSVDRVAIFLHILLPTSCSSK